MAALSNPRTWIPYANNRDCSQGFCSVYCPQLCYIVYPPPPPPSPTFEFPEDHDSTPNFSPLVIAIIGILASACLIVSYYTFISKYCGNRGNRGSSHTHDTQDEIEENNHNPSLHEPWYVATDGLDEALIKSITVCKYRKGDGLVGVTDCSVCLSEFQEDESVRLLPKCSHAFHLPCIDQWLKSHSNCPLCRAYIFPFNASTTQAPLPPPDIEEASSQNEEIQNVSEENVGVEMGGDAEEGRKTAMRAFSDLGFLQGRHTMIEIRDEDEEEGIRRSVSMDHSLQIAQVEAGSNEAGPSKRSQGESSKSNYRRRALHCVLSPIAMKKSFSSGRFSFIRSGRGRQGIIPV